MTDDEHPMNPDPGSETEGAGLSALDARGARAAQALRAIAASSPQRPVPVRARRVAPVVAVAALLVVAAVAVLLVRSQGSPTRTADLSGSSLYLVPSQAPQGYVLAEALDDTGSASSRGSATSSAPSSSLPRGILASFTFELALGDTSADDPLTRPLVAVWVQPSQHDVSQSRLFDPGFQVTPPGEVTRNGRHILTRSIKVSGAGSGEMPGAVVALPRAGVVTVWGRNVTQQQVVQVAATIKDVSFPPHASTTQANPALAPSWQEPVLAVLPRGSGMVHSGWVAVTTAIAAYLPQGFEPSSTLIYNGTRNQEPPQTIGVEVRAGGTGLLAMDRLFTRTEPMTVDGHRGWVLRWHPFGEQVAADDFSGVTAVEWVQAGNVVQVIGTGGVSVAKLEEVAASLHPVSAVEWHKLAGPFLPPQPPAQSPASTTSTPSPTTKIVVATGTSRGERYTVSVRVAVDDTGRTPSLCVEDPSGATCSSSTTSARVGALQPAVTSAVVTDDGAVAVAAVSSAVASVRVSCQQASSTSSQVSSRIVTVPGQAKLRVSVAELPTGCIASRVVALDANRHEIGALRFEG